LLEIIDEKDGLMNELRHVGLLRMNHEPVNQTKKISEIALSLIMKNIDELRRLCMTDPLTGTGNRRFGEFSIHRRLEKMNHNGYGFGILFIDIDNFKKINDLFGHDTGDMVLKMVGKLFARNLRNSDTICRWGGDEFVVIIDNINEIRLQSKAEKIRSIIEDFTFNIGIGLIKVTVSIGATIARPDDDKNSLLKRADNLMYQTKNAEGTWFQQRFSLRGLRRSHNIWLLLIPVGAP
jgi:diguanylate cyclase (GGDEF)-like protein